VGEKHVLLVTEEQRLRVLANRVARKMFGPKKDEVIAHTEKFRALYCSPNTNRVIKSRRMRWVVHVAHTGRGVYRVMVGKFEKKETAWKTQA
jgi:hypothetical protein